MLHSYSATLQTLATAIESPAQQTPVLVPCCPMCNCTEFSGVPYDYGEDPFTGYHHQGTLCTCARCNWEFQAEDHKLNIQEAQ